MPELSMHCSCGDTLTGRVSDPLLADVLIMEFSAAHQGEGCEPCDGPRHNDWWESLKKACLEGAKE